MSNQLTGIGASAGIAIAKAFVLENPALEIEQKTITDADAEIERFEAAVHIAKEELEIGRASCRERV